MSESMADWEIEIQETWDLLAQKDKNACMEHYKYFLLHEKGFVNDEIYYGVLKIACQTGHDLTLIPENIKQPLKKQILSSI